MGWNYGNWLPACFAEHVTLGCVPSAGGKIASKRAPDRISGTTPSIICHSARLYRPKTRNRPFHGHLLKWFHRRLKPRDSPWIMLPPSVVPTKGEIRSLWSPWSVVEKHYWLCENCGEKWVDGGSPKYRALM